MATGDTTDTLRPRLEANERLDLVDVDAITKAPREHLDAHGRAIIATPLATAASPVGLILTGASLTDNPTGAGDGKIRINSELAVAIDADGRFLVKPNGTAITVSVPAGGAQYQLYMYFTEAKAQQAKRRALSVTSPYVEYTFTPYTKAQGTVGVHLRSGGTGSIVPSDAVNGVTTALVFVAIVSNTAGTVTHITTAANNRFSTVKPPTTRPASSTASGSARTVHDLVQGSLYELARTKYTDQGALSGTTGDTVTGAGTDKIRIQGLVGMNAALVGQYITISGAASSGNNGVFRIASYISATTVDVFNPNGVVGDANDGAIVWSVFAHDLPGGSDPAQASTNYGAYAEPRRGLDAVDRSSEALITIGDGITAFGTFDLPEFADHGACLQAAVNACVAAGGGRVVLKPGVFLSSFSADIVITSDDDVAIEGQGFNTGFILGAYKIVTPDFSASETGRVYLRRLHFLGSGTVVQARGHLEAEGVYFANTTGDTASVVASGTGVTHLSFLKCTFESAAGTDDDTKTTAVYAPAGVLASADVVFDTCSVVVDTDGRKAITIDLEDTSRLKLRGCSFNFPFDAGSTLSAATAFVTVTGGSFLSSVVVDGCSFVGCLTYTARANFTGLHLIDAGAVLVTNCSFKHVRYGAYLDSVGTTTGQLTVTACYFDSLSASNYTSTRGISFAVAPLSTTVSACFFNATGFRVNAPQTAGYDVSGLVVRDCIFSNAPFSITANSVAHIFGGLSVHGCHFNSTISAMEAPSLLFNTSSGVARFSWRGNTHAGFFNTTDPDTCLGLRTVAYETDALVEGNVFRDINSGITYAGSTLAVINGGPNRLIAFEAHVQRWTVRGNRGERLGVSSSGANFQEITCIDAHAKSRGTHDAGTVLQDCVVADNSFGDAASCCTLLRVGSVTAGDPSVAEVGLQVGSLRVFGNFHRSLSSLASTSVAAYGWVVACENTAGVNSVFDSADNDWRIESPAGTLGRDWFRLLAISTVTFEVVLFSHNKVTVVGGAFAATYGVFIASSITVRSLAFRDNGAFVPSAGTTPVMYVQVTAATVTLPTVFTSGALADNLRINRN